LGVTDVTPRSVTGDTPFPVRGLQDLAIERRWSTDENPWKEVNRVAKKVSPRKPAAKKATKSSAKAATRVTRKTTMKKLKKS
jgi:hypothetical protein